MDEKKLGKTERSRSVASFESMSTSSLPNFVIRSLVDQYESKKHLNDQRKKRISSMRKVYSNIERDKIKKYNSVKDLNENKSVNFKDELKAHDKINVMPTQNKVTVDLKDFNLEKNQSNKNVTTLAILNENMRIKKSAKNIDAINTEKNIVRYIKHLKQKLKEKTSQLKLDLPPLCQCNFNQVNSLWENDWNSCANNCLFYKNPKGINVLYLHRSQKLTRETKFFISLTAPLIEI